MLIQAGLAKVHSSAYNAPNYKQLLEAEEKCRKERTGLWTDYEEPSEKENEEETKPEGTSSKNASQRTSFTVALYFRRTT